jgi:hypothetical protein
MFFAGVKQQKRYVSYYLMPVYTEPDLAAAVSPDLRRRMQGKSCFNFTKVDEGLFDELADLTARAATPTPARAGPSPDAAGGLSGQAPSAALTTSRASACTWARCSGPRKDSA